MELITIYMVINVSVTVENDEQIKKFKEIDYDVYFEFFDERYKKGKKDAWALKNKYGAKLNPFVEITLDGKFYTMIYSEVSEDPVKDLKITLSKLNKVINTINS